MSDSIVLRNPTIGGPDEIVSHPQQPEPYQDARGTWTWQNDQAWRLVDKVHLRVYDLASLSR